METPQNLWPSEIGQLIIVPKTVLVQQANFFNERTKNQLVAKVDSHTVVDYFQRRTIEHHFDIKAPSIGNYTFTLFTATHSMELYPVQLWSDLLKQSWEAGNEDQLLLAMKEIFNDIKTITAINGLLAQL